jgi:hypothetical protein
MRNFEISPLGMTPDDLADIDRCLAELRAESANFTTHYWSKERRILLLIVHVEGIVLDWEMVPCESKAAVQPMLENWLHELAARANALEALAQARRDNRGGGGARH